jgi:hypothetical protein
MRQLKRRRDPLGVILRAARFAGPQEIVAGGKAAASRRTPKKQGRPRAALFVFNTAFMTGEPTRLKLQELSYPERLL